MARATALKLKSDDAPEWLNVMRTLTGMVETPGEADNPKILAMADAIAQTYPDMEDYCAQYNHDSIAWCGLTVAYCMTMAGIRPVFGPTDTDKFLWAQAWADDYEFGTVIDEPVLGCIVVLTRSGGGHVTLYESTSGSNYMCRGGNQSDSVNLAPQAKSNVIALIWPNAAGPMPRRTIQKGSKGADVVELQEALGVVPADGDFGAVTDAQVRSFQAAAKLTADGVVGEQTWAAVDDFALRVDQGDEGVDPDVGDAILDLVGSSPLKDYSWPDRGKAPRAYLNGMALSFAVAVLEHEEGLSRAVEMAQAQRSDAETDALTWYKSQFSAKGMSNATAGLDTLRHLFVMMIGLGMRESSGKYYEGRDMSASNTSSETCEAGLFQTSWNIRSCSSNIPPLLGEYWEDPNGFLPEFQMGLTPTSAGLGSYGSGDGARYQFLAKTSPAFAAMVTGIGMRKLRKHWGPINREEVTINSDADELLRRVQELVLEGEVPEPEPEPEPPPVGEVARIDLVTTGPVIISINGEPVYGPPELLAQAERDNRRGR